MILISHRGNISGPNPERENSPDYIDEAIAKGYYVEVDIRMTPEGDYFLGHDNARYEVSLQWLDKRRHWLVLHCKNITALYRLKYGFIAFYHDVDDHVLMSNTHWIWTYPGKPITLDSIAVLPETIYGWDIHLSKGVCSDFVEDYKND